MRKQSSILMVQQFAIFCRCSSASLRSGEGKVRAHHTVPAHQRVAIGGGSPVQGINQNRKPEIKDVSPAHNP